MLPSEECSSLEQHKIAKNLGINPLLILYIFYIKYILHCRFYIYIIALDRYSDIFCKPLHIINYTNLTISLPTPCGSSLFLIAHVVHCFVSLLIVVASKL